MQNNKRLIQDLQECFLGDKEVENYKIEKKYLEKHNRDLQIFYTKIFKTDIQQRGSVLFIHGLGEHSGRNLNLAVNFCDMGFETHLIDLTGFGFSFGERAMASQKELFEDLVLAMKQISTDMPCFLVGHSMGGGSILAFLRLNPHLNIAGVICSNPFIDYHQKENISEIEKTLIMWLPKKVLVRQKENELQPTSRSIQIIQQSKDDLKFIP